MTLLDDIISDEAASKRVKAVAKVTKATNLGRPSKLTPAMARRILGYMLEGAYKETACQAVGISKVTLRNWEARAEEFSENGHEIPESERLFVEFFNALKLAEAQAELRLLRAAATGQRGWQASMTVLERKYPSRWGRSEKRIHEGGDPAKPIAFDLESEEERRQSVAKILQETGALDGEAEEPHQD